MHNNLFDTNEPVIYKLIVKPNTEYLIALNVGKYGQIDGLNDN